MAACSVGARIADTPMKTSPAMSCGRIEFRAAKRVIARHQHDQRILSQQPEFQAGRLLLRPQKSQIDFAAHQTGGEIGRILAVDHDLGRGQFGVEDFHDRRQPVHLIAGQKADRERGPWRLRRAPRGLAGGFDLQQRDPGVIEEYAAGRGQLDAARAAVQELHADFQFQIVNLPAQRRLRGMQPLLRGHGQAAFFRHGDEITEMPELHSHTP